MAVKRWVLMMLCLCPVLWLWGCGPKEPDPGQISACYTGRDFSAQYTVTSHGPFFAQYQLACEQSGGLSRVTILQPQSVAGIAAVLQEGEVRLQYQDLSLDALTPEVPGYAPMDVLHGLLEDLRSQSPDSFSREGEGLVLTYQSTLTNGTAARKLVTLHPETLDLQSAECYLEDSLVLALQVESLTWTAP